MNNAALLWLHSFTNKEVSNIGVRQFSNTGTTIIGAVNIDPSKINPNLSFYFSTIGEPSTRQIGSVG